MPPAPRKSTGSKTRRIYGRQRSFLGQDGVACRREGEYGLEEAAQPRPVSQLKRGNSNLRALPAIKRGISSLSGGNNEPNVALRASHELREAGQSHRFKDEIEYILHGIRSNNKLNIRRTSCLDLSRSMLRQEFAEQVKAHHYMPIIFESICIDRDPIVFSCLVLMIGIVLQDEKGWRDVMTISNLVDFLCEGLKMSADPMAVLPTGRHEISMYNDFKDIVRQAGIIQKGQKVLTMSIILSTLAYIVNGCVSMQDAGTLSVVTQDSAFIEAIINILVDDLAWIKQPSSTPDVALSDVLDIDRIENCLRILERLALICRRPAAALAANIRLFPLLVQLIALCRAHAFQYPQRTESLSLMLHTLRLLINVTNGFEPCCDNLAQSGSIAILVQNFVQFYSQCRNYNPERQDTEPLSSADVNKIQWTMIDSRSDSGLSFQMLPQDDAASCCVTAGTLDLDFPQPSLDATLNASHRRETIIENDANGWYDILLLSIGLLVNMLETNPDRREQVTRAAIGLECKAIGDCFHKECRCEKSMEALERLVEIYNTEATISEMTENQVLAAYLALLIGCIVGENREYEARLYKSINGGSLVPIVDLLKEFVALHQTVQATQEDGDQVMSTQRSCQELTDGSTDGFDAIHSGDEKALSEISFSSASVAETHSSFLKIIQVLQEIETRTLSLGSSHLERETDT